MQDVKMEEISLQDSPPPRSNSSTVQPGKAPKNRAQGESKIGDNLPDPPPPQGLATRHATPQTRCLGGANATPATAAVQTNTEKQDKTPSQLTATWSQVVSGNQQVTHPLIPDGVEVRLTSHEKKILELVGQLEPLYQTTSNFQEHELSQKLMKNLIDTGLAFLPKQLRGNPKVRELKELAHDQLQPWLDVYVGHRATRARIPLEFVVAWPRVIEDIIRSSWPIEKILDNRKVHGVRPPQYLLQAILMYGEGETWPFGKAVTPLRRAHVVTFTTGEYMEEEEKELAQCCKRQAIDRGAKREPTQLERKVLHGLEKGTIQTNKTPPCLEELLGWEELLAFQMQNSM